MNEREKIIRLWFDMWIKKADLGIDNIFTDDVVYTESWSPKYENRKTVKHWFDEWNTRGSVLVWEIKQFFHQGNQTIVEWYFKSKMNNKLSIEYIADWFSSENQSAFSISRKGGVRYERNRLQHPAP